MKKVIEKLIEIANKQDLKASAKSINQTQRNLLNSELTQALLSDMGNGCECDSGVYIINDFVNVGQIDSKTIEFNVDNENVGLIPVRISVVFPNFDNENDLYDRVAEYQKKVKLDQEKKEQIKRENELKAKADAERRTKAKALRESSTEK